MKQTNKENPAVETAAVCTKSTHKVRKIVLSVLALIVLLFGGYFGYEYIANERTPVAVVQGILGGALGSGRIDKVTTDPAPKPVPAINIIEDEVSGLTTDTYIVFHFTVSDPEVRKGLDVRETINTNIVRDVGRSIEPDANGVYTGEIYPNGTAGSSGIEFCYGAAHDIIYVTISYSIWIKRKTSLWTVSRTRAKKESPQKFKDGER